MTVWMKAGLLAIVLGPPAASIEQKVQSVLPRPEEERWLQIPWRTSLMQARAESQAAGKPIFLWVMNGNPLGCT
jgi:hypothetical protein